MSEQTLLDKFLAQYTPFSTKHGPVYDLLYTIAKRCQECEGSTAKISLAAPLKVIPSIFDDNTDFGTATMRFGIEKMVREVDDDEEEVDVAPFYGDPKIIRNLDFYATVTGKLSNPYLKVTLADDREIRFPVQVFQGNILHVLAVINAEVFSIHLVADDVTTAKFDIQCNYDYLGWKGVEVKDSGATFVYNPSDKFIDCLDKDGKIVFSLPPGASMVDMTDVVSMSPDDVTLSSRKLE